MNLKRTLFTGLAAVGLMASVAAPMVSAQATEDGSRPNTITSEIDVYTDGIFDVYFNSSTFDLDDVTLNATDPTGSALGEFTIVYEDTKANRPAFDLRVSATDFMLVTNTDIRIPATGFTIDATTGVGSLQWGNPPTIGDIGDIGTFVNELDPGGQPNPANTVVQWGPGYSLEGNGRLVHYAFAGIGTIASGSKAFVELEVPSTTIQGTYRSTVTLSVVAGSQP